MWGEALCPNVCQQCHRPMVLHWCSGAQVAVSVDALHSQRLAVPAIMEAWDTLVVVLGKTFLLSTLFLGYATRNRPSHSTGSGCGLPGQHLIFYSALFVLYISV